MVPGKNLKFKIEDLNIDESYQIVFLCGLGIIIWFKIIEATVIGSEFTCNKPCAQIIFSHDTDVGGRGFKFSFTSDE
ncbi:hypothetical protein ACJMK2_017941 [Sinanodonta woodiana]|uniref:CUB domain-containing protein n=1 Tax=Sinanodonta woodiana TaxID=1069815 RepID=A0ABD3UEW3_SINWO